MVNQTEMDRTLYSSMWISQCKAMDTSLLDFSDVVLVQKCIHQQEITDEELEQLRIILRDYNNINKEINVSEMEDNIIAFKDEISSEQEFLELIDTQTPQKITKEYNVNGKLRKVNFIVKPVVDSRVVYDIVEHADIFAQLTDKEQEIYQKANQGTLNERETKILDRLNKKIQRMMTTSDNLEYMVDNFLAKQVELENSTLHTDEERMEFWKKVDGMVKMDLFSTVKDLVGVGGELFR